MKLVELKAESRESIVYATLRGEIDMSDTAELRDQLNAIMTNEALGMVLDLSAVDYLDSAGIHLLQGLRKGLQARNQRLVVVIPHESLISHALRLAGVQWDDDMVQSVEAARQLMEHAV
jgi:anti-sigma B factor antagonist